MSTFVKISNAEAFKPSPVGANAVLLDGRLEAIVMLAADGNPDNIELPSWEVIERELATQSGKGLLYRTRKELMSVRVMRAILKSRVDVPYVHKLMARTLGEGDVLVERDAKALLLDAAGAGCAHMVKALGTRHDFNPLIMAQALEATRSVDVARALDDVYPSNRYHALDCVPTARINKRTRQLEHNVITAAIDAKNYALAIYLVTRQQASLVANDVAITYHSLYGNVSCSIPASTVCTLYGEVLKDFYACYLVHTLIDNAPVRAVLINKSFLASSLMRLPDGASVDQQRKRLAAVAYHGRILNTSLQSLLLLIVVVTDDTIDATVEAICAHIRVNSNGNLKNLMHVLGSCISSNTQPAIRTCIIGILQRIIGNANSTEKIIMVGPELWLLFGDDECARTLTTLLSHERAALLSVLTTAFEQTRPTTSNVDETLARVERMVELLITLPSTSLLCHLAKFSGDKALGLLRRWAPLPDDVLSSNISADALTLMAHKGICVIRIALAFEPHEFEKFAQKITLTLDSIVDAITSKNSAYPPIRTSTLPLALSAARASDCELSRRDDIVSRLLAVNAIEVLELLFGNHGWQHECNVEETLCALVPAQYGIFARLLINKRRRLV